MGFSRSLPGLLDSAVACATHHAVRSQRLMCCAPPRSPSLLQVKYSDRFVEELHLPVEKLDFGPTKPVITFDPADCGFSDMVRCIQQTLGIQLPPSARQQTISAQFRELQHWFTSSSRCVQTPIVLPVAASESALVDRVTCARRHSGRLERRAAASADPAVRRLRRCAVTPRACCTSARTFPPAASSTTTSCSAPEPSQSAARVCATAHRPSASAHTVSYSFATCPCRAVLC